MARSPPMPKPPDRKKPSTSRRKAAPRRKEPSTGAPQPSSAPASANGHERPRVPIVGVGASAGGLESFSALLRALPADPHLAFVLVQHLAPTHESMLADLLARCTAMPILQVTDGTRVQPDRVYVIPPNANMAIRDGVLHLLARSSGAEHHMPIDFFLRSLAEDQQNNAIGVILSGTASDGALGLRAVKAEGGITIAHDPSTAKYDGMPRAAIAAGAVDLVLTIEGIAAELTRLGRHPHVRSEPAERLDESEDHLKRIFFLLRQLSGVDFTHYKPATIKRRLTRRMALHKLERLQDYVRLLHQVPDEIGALYQDMLIHVTGFFREPEAFEALRSVVFPRILAERPEGARIRIWVPGCSTGEETYSIAITLLEYLDRRGHQPVDAQIFATDVSQNAIDQARAGSYPDNIKADVQADRLRRFFTPVDGGYRVTKSVRDLCVFARQDLTRDPPFSQLDLISCRNVLIYLGPVLQKRAMTIFHYALKPTGFLLLGASETIGSYAELFASADKQHKLYAKKTTVGRPYVGFAAEYTSDRLGLAKPHAAGRARGDLQTEVDRLLLARLAPTGVVVNGDLQLVQVRGQTGKYLEPAVGDASLNVLKMARPGLMIELRTAFHAARKRNQPVEKKGVRVKQNGHVGIVDVEVVPLDSATGEKLWLILFRDGTPAPDAAAPHRPPLLRVTGKRTVRSRVTELEQELNATREYLHSIIHDQEATNEELQSANEEILSSNEELQSTNEELETAKEELQSTNEELNTLNEELHTRNQELSQANNDLTNLLASVHIPIIMIGSDLRIRRFTPMAGVVVNLIPADVGRPSTDIRGTDEIPERLITETIDSVQVRELPVHTTDGRTYSMRLRPYKTADNHIDGCVVALVDLRSTHLADGGTAAAWNESAMVVLDRQLRVLDASARFCKQHGLPAQALHGQRLDTVLQGRFAAPEMLDVVQRLVAGEPALAELQHTHYVHDGEQRRVRLAGCRLPGPDVAVLLMIERDEAAAGHAAPEPRRS